MKKILRNGSAITLLCITAATAWATPPPHAQNPPLPATQAPHLAVTNVAEAKFAPTLDDLAAAFGSSVKDDSISWLGDRQRYAAAAAFNETLQGDPSVPVPIAAVTYKNGSGTVGYVLELRREGDETLVDIYDANGKYLETVKPVVVEVDGDGPVQISWDEDPTAERPRKVYVRYYENGKWKRACVGVKVTLAA